MNSILKNIINSINPEGLNLSKENEKLISEISSKFDEFENSIAAKENDLANMSSKIINTLSIFSENNRSIEHLRYKISTIFEDLNIITDPEIKRNLSSLSLIDMIDLLGEEIKRRKNAEKVFLKEQAKLISLIENTDDAILLLDNDLNLSLYNSSFKSFIEKVLSKKPQLGDSIINYLPEHIKLTWTDYFKKTLDGEHIHFEWSINKNSTTDQYEISFNPIIAGTIGKKVIAGISIFARNINERKKSETELRNSQDHLFNIINSISDPIFVKDRNHRMIFANKAHCKLLKRTQEEIIGKTDYDFHLKEEADVFWENDEKVFNSGMENVNEENNTNSDGITHYVITKKALYKNNSGEQFIVGVVNDITSLKLAEENIKNMNRNLEEKINDEVNKNREKDSMLLKQSRNAAMGEMIGNIAHQWRQPLNGLALIIQDIQESFIYNELTESYLQNSVSKSMGIIQHMSQTIDDFRNFFKPDKDKQEFSIRSVLEKTLSFVEASFRNNKIEMILEISTEKSVFGFPNEYSQVIINILNNAKDALLERSIKHPQVKITLKDLDGKSCLTIEDNAGGINNDIIDKVFNPYFTTKEQGKGTGIGLYMSKTIIEKNMDGKLVVNNTPNGAEFSIII